MIKLRKLHYVRGKYPFYDGKLEVIYDNGTREFIELELDFEYDALHVEWPDKDVDPLIFKHVNTRYLLSFKRDDERVRIVLDILRKLGLPEELVYDIEPFLYEDSDREGKPGGWTISLFVNDNLNKVMKLIGWDMDEGAFNFINEGGEHDRN